MMISSAYSPIPPEKDDVFEHSDNILSESGFKRKKWASVRDITIHLTLILLYTITSLAIIRANSADELSSHGWFEMAIDE